MHFTHHYALGNEEGQAERAAGYLLPGPPRHGAGKLCLALSFSADRKKHSDGWKPGFCLYHVWMSVIDEDWEEARWRLPSSTSRSICHIT